MIMAVTCEQCGAKFMGYYTSRFCAECKRQRNLAYMRAYVAAHRGDETRRERHRTANRRYCARRKEAQAC